MRVGTRGVVLVGSSEKHLQAAAEAVREMGGSAGGITLQSPAEFEPGAAAARLVVWVDADDGASVPWPRWTSSFRSAGCTR